jgi:DNA polymerase-1
MTAKASNLIVLIDGNNTCFRVGWANKHLTNNGEPTGVIYGVFREILAVWQRWRDARIAIVWDRGAEYRLRLSKEAIAKGIITEKQGYYKQNRERKREKEAAEGKVNDLVEAIDVQKPTLKEILKLTLAQQVEIEGYEADDIIGSLAKIHSEKGDVVKIISSDKDMYQLLSDKVSILSISGKGGMSLDGFCGEYNLSPNQWIDIGALAGDSGDNIHGVKGVAEKTAIKMLLEAQKGLGIDSGKATYKDLIAWLKSKKKRKKKEESILNCCEIIHLAYKLKKIDTDIKSLEPVTYMRSDPISLKKWLEKLGFVSIIPNTGLLTRRAWT